MSEQEAPKDSKSHLVKGSWAHSSVSLPKNYQHSSPSPPCPGLCLLIPHPGPPNWEGRADHRRTWFPLLLAALCIPEASEWLSPVPSGARMYQTRNMDLVLEGSRCGLGCFR